MRFLFCFFNFIMVFLLGASVASAHFGMIIPSKSTILDKKDASLSLTLSFAHPFAQNGMNMEKPREFFVLANGERQDLLSSLKQAKYLDNKAWQATYQIKKPGVYIFADMPEPYFEPAEDCFIIHYAKTVVSAFGGEDGWQNPAGLPVEIIPLSRPFANYAGNVFVGKVLQDGKPAPNIEVEVENLNAGSRHAAPNDYFETQTVLTDENGVFVFGIPWSGWWGFAALCEGKGKMQKDGQEKDVELGGVLWLQFSQPRLTDKK